VGIDQTALSVATALTAETLRTPVKNSSGSTISKGQVVYVTGADGTNALIGLATASTEAGSSKTLGIAASTMTNNAFGYVIENGQLSNIDTSAATAGSSVWLGNTPGSYVFNSPPAKPANNVYLGVVTKANVSTGEILVKVQNGYELDELHDINVTGVSTALPLVYNSTSSSWIAQELSSVGIADNAIVASKIAASQVTSGHILAGAVGSAALADNAVVAAKINAAAVGTAKIDSTGGSNGWVLTANGSGAATFAAASGGGGGIIAVTSITANTTIALTDKDDLLYVNSASNLTITIPPNSTAAFSVADQVHLLRAGTGTVTVVAGTGVTVQRTYGLTLRAQWSSATLIKTDTNTWILVGDIA
jgi:predicted aconitase with swiveling domain